LYWATNLYFYERPYILLGVTWLCQPLLANQPTLVGKPLPAHDTHNVIWHWWLIEYCHADPAPCLASVPLADDSEYSNISDLANERSLGCTTIFPRHLLSILGARYDDSYDCLLWVRATSTNYIHPECIAPIIATIATIAYCGDVVHSHNSQQHRPCPTT